MKYLTFHYPKKHQWNTGVLVQEIIEKFKWMEQDGRILVTLGYDGNTLYIIAPFPQEKDETEVYKEIAAIVENHDHKKLTPYQQNLLDNHNEVAQYDGKNADDLPLHIVMKLMRLASQHNKQYINTNNIVIPPEKPNFIYTRKDD